MFSKLKKFCPRESAEVLRNILSSGKAIWKNSIRGLMSLTERLVFKSSHSLGIITRDMEGHDIGPEEIHLHRLGRRDSNSVKDWKVCGREFLRRELIFSVKSSSSTLLCISVSSILRLAEVTQTCGMCY